MGGARTSSTRSARRTSLAMSTCMAVLSRHQTASGGIAATQVLHSVSSAATQQVRPWMLALGGPCLVTARVGTSGGPACRKLEWHIAVTEVPQVQSAACRYATPVHAPSTAGLHGASFRQFSAAQVADALGGLKDVLPLEASRRAVTRQGPPSASSQGVVFACQIAARCSGDAHRPFAMATLCGAMSPAVQRCLGGPSRGTMPSASSQGSAPGVSAHDTLWKAGERVALFKSRHRRVGTLAARARRRSRPGIGFPWGI
jgi:hypothetical protein